MSVCCGVMGAIAGAVQDRHGGGLIRTFQGIMI